MDDEPLDTKAVARILGLSPRTIEDWRAARENYGPPFHRVGRRAIRYYRSELEQWRHEQDKTRRSA